MNQWKKITPEAISENPFSLIGKDWTLITGGNTLEHYNTMTASWGGVGVLWNKPVATIYIRPQRYTMDFVEECSTFTLTFFSEEYRKALNFCGSHSGRDVDKAKECNLTPFELDGGVAFAEGKLIMTCKKLYHQDIDPAGFLFPEIAEANYPKKDYHRIFIGEILGVYIK